MANRKRMKKGFQALGIVVLALAAYFGYPIARVALAAVRQGFFEKSQPEKYVSTTQSNLQAIYKGIMLYHDSEGQFPASTGWMDAIQNRIQSGTMTSEEAAKKLVDPSFAGQLGKYGYAMNDAVSQKYLGDLKDKSTILVFMSSDTGKNAHGVPKRLAPNPPRGNGNFAITIAGKIIPLN
jgi:hypothetical protein